MEKPEIYPGCAEAQKPKAGYALYSKDFLQRTGAGYYNALWISCLSWAFIMAAFSIVHAFLLSLFRFRGSVLGNSGILFAVLLTGPLLFFGYFLFRDLRIKMTAYRFENGNLVKGTIRKADQVPGELAAAGMLSGAALSHLFGGSDLSLNAARAMAGFNVIGYLIRLNSNEKFVRSAFDTDWYRRKVYKNPALVKETRYHWIFRTEDGKTLRVIKAYDLMPHRAFGDRPRSVSRWTLGCLGIMTVLSFALYAGDFCYAASINNTVNETFQATVADLSFFEQYGYEIDHARCRKEVGDRYAELTLEIDRRGNVVRFFPDLYFTKGDPSAKPIAAFLMNDLGFQFSQADQAAFLEAVDRFVGGDFSQSLTIRAEGSNAELTVITDGKTYFRIR